MMLSGAELNARFATSRAQDLLVGWVGIPSFIQSHDSDNADVVWYSILREQVYMTIDSVLKVKKMLRILVWFLSLLYGGF